MSEYRCCEKCELPLPKFTTNDIYCRCTKPASAASTPDAGVPASPREFWIYESPTRFKDKGGVKSLGLSVYDQRVPVRDSIEFHVIEKSAYLEVVKERDADRNELARVGWDKIQAQEQVARLEGERIGELQLLGAQADQIEKLQAENAELKATEKVYRMNRDWIEVAKFKIQGLESDLAYLRESGRTDQDIKNKLIKDNSELKHDHEYGLKVNADMAKTIAELRAELESLKRQCADQMSGCCDCSMYKAARNQLESANWCADRYKAALETLRARWDKIDGQKTTSYAIVEEALENK